MTARDPRTPRNGALFLDLPYFTEQYVNLGPFRLVDFGLGQNMVFERFNDFYLGRPKISRIVTHPNLTQTYDVGGHAPGGLTGLAGPVDRVLGEQLARLKAYTESGKTP